ncbi:MULTISPECIES: hypothetical protein [Alysiella]|uniref:Toxin-antitoxin system, antitoxin component, ribbon-helix-helix domain protein n=2 Tax=Alysiella TaxID=194195 RepID=A0A376BUG6_9NEIS|nr:MULTISPECIES: hypothetical protein [Alysiella]QMT30731.1 hypothetical protein H3L97_08265 [Alysiella filiformis]UBQ56289.1 hypothetical protein JF568_00420 [Alysiella filiformis DSM 16848]UOP06027.1 hypothetical protein LVJ80_09205 [Alysiella crassa]SOD64730.1 hypothetical protein SAMN02746062_00006 [Alysiella filiformis DSM 16848]SSY80478.1 Uncharacterised protein [Alysiella crassa]
MVIDLPPHIEQMVLNQALARNISVSALIEQWAKQDDMLLIDFFKQNPPIDAFADIDPVAYQRAVRDEW